MKKIYVRWHDSTSWDHWRNLPLQDTELCIVETIGWLIEEQKDRIVIAHSVSDAGHAHGIIAIPKAAIFAKRYVRN